MGTSSKSLRPTSPQPKAKKAHASFLLGSGSGLAYWTLALGSAFALFMYPHSITAVLSTKDRHVIRRNSVLLFPYSFLLGLIALLGYMAIAAHVTVTNTNLAVPELFQKEFPHWFVGIAFSAIAIGALVPAAIMSIAAANLFTRNVWVEFFDRDATPEREASVARIVSLLVRADREARGGRSCRVNDLAVNSPRRPIAVAAH